MHRLAPLAALTWAALLAPLVAGRDRALAGFPPELARAAGYLDVRDYGARGDGVHDDTEAIRRALAAAADTSLTRAATVYLPAGTYLVRDRLILAGGAAGRVGLQGEGRNATYIRLGDASAGYADPERPRAILLIGRDPEGAVDSSAPAPRREEAQFGVLVRELTIDSGVGNSGAVGLAVRAGDGSIEDVVVRGGDAGATGLAITGAGAGSWILQRVRIEGFDRGAVLEGIRGSVTCEHLHLMNQRKAGLEMDLLIVTIRGLYSDQWGTRAPALRCGAGPVDAGTDARPRRSVLVVHGGELLGRSPLRAAIEPGDADVVLRDVGVEGYAGLVGGAAAIGGVTSAGPSEFASVALRTANDGSSPVALRLPVREVPYRPWPGPGGWASVVAFGATPDDDRDDDAVAIQAAIDAGMAEVLFPRGIYHMRRAVRVRGEVARLIGAGSVLAMAPGWPAHERDALLRIDPSAAEFVELDGLELRLSALAGGSAAIEHAADRPLVLRHVAITGGTDAFRAARGAGPLFLEDVYSGGEALPRWRLDRGQESWARHLRLSGGPGAEPALDVRGGRHWLMGVSGPVGASWLSASDGAEVELVGAARSGGSRGLEEAPPLIEDLGSSVAADVAVVPPTAEAPIVRESEDGRTTILRAGADVPGAPHVLTRYADLRPSAPPAPRRFTNPVVPSGADPWVIAHEGAYYFCQSRRGSIWVCRTERLLGIGTEPWVRVWTPPRGTDYSRDLWAPELHYVRGKWYIYVAADDGDNANHRIHVLEGTTQDPTDPFVYRGKLAAPGDHWAIDGTILEMDDGRLYFLWSGWEGRKNVAQNLYIAPMSSPTQISGERVCISRPDRPWERRGRPLVNEGPQVLRNGERLFVVYSASGSWSDDYCLGLLTWTGGDVLDPASWKKAPRPVFCRTPEVFGPGHCSFVKSRDGREDWIVYHAAKHRGAGWNRNVRLQPFTWNADGSPNFGAPIASGIPLPVPGGE